MSTTDTTPDFRAEAMERLCAQRARDLVTAAGGSITFDEYDAAYAKQHAYAFVPFTWAIVGMDNGPSARKKNQGVLSAHKAVALGWIRMNAARTGYEVGG